MSNLQRTRIIFLFVLGAITIWFCYLIAKPFLKPVFIALIFAIIFFPLHARIQRSVRNQTLAALLSTVFVLLIIIIPATLIGITIRREIAAFLQSLSEQSAKDGGLALRFVHSIDQFTKWLGQF